MASCLTAARVGSAALVSGGLALLLSLVGLLVVEVVHVDISKAAFPNRAGIPVPAGPLRRGPECTEARCGFFRMGMTCSGSERFASAELAGCFNALNNQDIYYGDADWPLILGALGIALGGVAAVGAAVALAAGPAGPVLHGGSGACSLASSILLCACALYVIGTYGGDAAFAARMRWGHSVGLVLAGGLWAGIAAVCSAIAAWGGRAEAAAAAAAAAAAKAGP